MNVKDTILEALDIEIIKASPDEVICTMLVGPKTRQPAGVLHGGASLVLAETAASVGTFIQIDQEREIAAGMEINANHVRPVSSGIVTAVAVPLHKGKTSFVWDIKITDDQNRLVCVSRCTVAVVKKKV